MSLILNEYEWAENMLRGRELGKKPIETLGSISRYYYKQQYNRKEIREKLELFVLKCNPNASLSAWADTLDRISKQAGKYPLIDIDCVEVSASELEKIDAVRGKQQKRLAFTLLCVAKFWNSVRETNNNWVNNKDNEIMSMANINTSIRRQSAMFAELRDAGLIEFSKKIDSLNIRVLFVGDGEAVMTIRDFRNLGYQYMKYCGEPYFECVNCGITTRMRNPDSGRPQKYCNACAAEIYLQQRLDYQTRRIKNSATL